MGMESFNDKSLNINEKPAWQANYEKFRGYLEETLDKLTPAEIAQAEKEIQDTILFESDSGKDVSGLYDLKSALTEVGILKGISKRDERIETLAKTKVISLGTAERMTELGYGSSRPPKLVDPFNAVYHLSQIVKSLAEWKGYESQFPKTDEKVLEEKRDELMKKNVR